MKRSSSRQFPCRLRTIVSVEAWMRGFFSWARRTGSRSPASRARIIASPVSPVMSLMTLANWIFISTMAFCMCCTHVPAAATRFSRWRNRDRRTQIESSGRNESFSNPKVWSCCSHWQSATSVLRPGTFLAWRALTSRTSNPRASSTWYNAIQYTPVDSMATVSMPQAASQLASACRSAVKLSNRRTGFGSRSGGTAT